MPGLSGVDSRLVVPAMALGQLVGIIVVESSRPAAFDPLDEQALGAVAGTVANAIELLRTLEADDVASRFHRGRRRAGDRRANRRRDPTGRCPPLRRRRQHVR